MILVRILTGIGSSFASILIAASLYYVLTGIDLLPGDHGARWLVLMVWAAAFLGGAFLVWDFRRPTE